MSTNQVALLESNHEKSKREVLRRVSWIVAWKVLASWTPRLFNAWRVFLLRAFGAKVGKKVLVLGSVRIDMPWNLSIGDFSALGERVWVYNFGFVKIGDNTVVSQDTVLCTATHDYTHPHMPLLWKPITIENQVWVAANCYIMPGVTISEGTVVGVNSLVTKDLPEWKVCVGQPCRPVKNRVLKPR